MAQVRCGAKRVSVEFKLQVAVCGRGCSRRHAPALRRVLLTAHSSALFDRRM
jgi:hypothetical protein